MNYQEKRAARIERYKERAERAKTESKNLWDETKKMMSVIPFGQPILIGHHSEQRDRNYRDRIHRKGMKAIEAHEKAKYWEQRAEAAEKNTAISSDDPEAVARLKEKISACEKLQEIMKAANKIVKNKKLSDQEKVDKLNSDLRLKKEKGWKLLKPDFCGRIGFPDYELKNNNANIRRMKKRLEELETLQAENQETKEKTYGDISVVENVEENRIQIFFPGKPDRETRDILKSHGFRWSPRNMAWQRHLNSAGKWAAEAVLTKLNTV